MIVHIPSIREFEVMHTGRFGSYYDMAIAFAVAHCEAQRQAILENVDITTESQYSQQEGSICEIDKDSITNAYPLSNIK